MTQILVIDPAGFFIEKYHKLLVEKEYVFSFVQNEKILREELSKTIDLVIVDVDGKGLSYLSQARQINSYVPILTFSSDISFELTQNLLKLRVQDLLPKVAKPEELLATLKNILHGSTRTYYQEKPILLNQLEEKIHELSIFNELVKTLTSTLELKEVLRVIMLKIKDLVKYEALSLLLWDKKKGELVFSATETTEADKLEGIRLKLGQGVAGWVAKKKQPLLVDDVYKDPRFFQGIDKEQGFKTRSIMCAPLMYQGTLVGVIEVINKCEGGAFTNEELQALMELTSSFSADIRGVHNHSTSAKTDKILKNLITQTKDIVKAEAYSILILDEGREELVFSVSETLRGGVGKRDPAPVQGLRLKLGQGIAGWVGSTKEPLLVDDVQKDPRFFREIDKLSHFQTKSIICVPLVSKNKLLGVIEIINKSDGSSFTEKEFQLVLSLADHAAVAIENAMLYRQVALSSITDDLTKLYNARYLNRFLIQEIQRSKAEGLQMSLLLLDLDNFKKINDSYGHLIGSQTLVEVAQIMKSKLRKTDVVGRFGGDEFIIILPETGPDVAVSIAEEIRNAIDALKVLKDFDVDISMLSASVGVATYPDHGKEMEELIRKADQAMYQVKQRSKNGVELAN